MIEESELISKLRERDESGFEYLYRNYSAALYGIVFRILKDEDEAVDLLQEAFVKIWDKIGQYDKSKGKLFTWMANLTRNLAIDRIRSADYKNHNLKNFVRKDEKVALVDREHNALINIDTVGLSGLIEKLDEPHQTLIRKLYFEGYTQVDLAEELEIPLGTLKTRLRAAIRKLRNYFD
ncbi:sigma-70 family RNA polymerase sigma factor [Marinilongibacter aquaticus]|uniref:RNA polymerase sigma factor n=1 Tax=Marinilongibacter aquaticus TaxID=2975157 RepID=UPI0021BDA60D|nr:sigma-70 family RNA polymerase sigma factor [Marinilongibacter aquaticus]UBM59769.1 sigma-70 family RNA polymerase sigma factor [Marinilongibacter aquaticus]